MAVPKGAFLWMTPEERLTAGWMVREALREKEFGNLVSAATAFDEFLGECRARFLHVELAGEKTAWN